MGYFDEICWKVVKYEIFWPIEFTKMFLKLFLFICGWSPLVRWFNLLRSLQNCLCSLLWINVVYFLSWLKFWKNLASIYRLNKKVGVGRMKNYWENTSVPVNPLSDPLAPWKPTNQRTRSLWAALRPPPNPKASSTSTPRPWKRYRLVLGGRASQPDYHC